MTLLFALAPSVIAEFPKITLPAPAAVPPIRLSWVAKRARPELVSGLGARAAVPAALTPM
jgi:hypothetical protein